MIRKNFKSLAAIAMLTAVLCLILGKAASADDDAKPIRALLVIGGCCHDYAKQKEILTKGISARANVQWAIAYDPDTGTKHLNPVYEKEDWAKDFDVIVHDECCSDVKDLKLIDRILKPHRNGLPAVLLHCGMHCYRSEGFPKTTPWFEFTGLITTTHGPQAPIDITFTDKESPITTGLANWKTVNEELYNNFIGKLQETAQPLARQADLQEQGGHGIVGGIDRGLDQQVQRQDQRLRYNSRPQQCNRRRRSLPRSGDARAVVVGREAGREAPEAGEESAVG